MHHGQTGIWQLCESLDSFTQADCIQGPLKQKLATNCPIGIYDQFSLRFMTFRLAPVTFHPEILD
jgi:hypothetical protein